MKKNLSRLIALLASGAMMASLTACGSTSATANSVSGDVTGVSNVLDAQAEASYDTDYDGTAGSANDYFEPVAESVDSFEEKTVPCYISDADTKSDISIGIVNDISDIAYVSLDTVADLMQKSFEAFEMHADDFKMDVGPATDDGMVYAMVRENDATMVVDFNTGKISITDPALFSADPSAVNGLDSVTINESGDQTMIGHTSVFYLTGDTLQVDLPHYGILSFVQDDEGYLPLQTVADLIFSRIGLYVLYNGEEVIVTDSVEYPFTADDEAYDELLGGLTSSSTTDETASDDTSATTDAAATGDTSTATDISANDDTSATEDTSSDDTSSDDQNAVTDESSVSSSSTAAEQTLSEIYYSADRGEKSAELTTFTYNELCLALDYNYGLQSEHDIDSFNDLFLKSGLAEKMKSTEAGDVFLGITDLCTNYFGDSHSGSIVPSWLTDLDPNSYDVVTLQMGSNSFDQTYNTLLYDQCREEANPDGVEGYEEIGNTAYITFDIFDIDPERDYYNTEITENKDDTAELIIYAHKQITREGSPIKKVVVDLSNNGGGAVDAAACVLSWMLGGANINMTDPITGAQSSTRYEFDANQDGSFDYMSDSLLGRVALYCIISPNSFSCGNLVPYMLADSNRVTLIGRASAGGTCCVQPMSTADGNVFQISGTRQISTIENGSYYNVDDGIEPDVYISSLRHLYDHTYLTDMIDNLP